jgi:tetratricopeptide (TPR) repeat protein
MPRKNQPQRHLIHWLALRVRYVIALGTLLVCIWGANSSARAGLSRLLSEFASSSKSLAAARHALDFNDADPNAQYAYAVELANAGKNSEAIASLEPAISLRPKDYFLWQELGRLQEDDDTAGSLRALRKATELAPYYSEPHWQLGNLLLRKGKATTAFTEMRLAVESDPTLFPLMIDLVWGVCAADVNCAFAITEPQTDTERVSLGSFLIANKKVDAGESLVLAASRIDPEDRRKLVAGLVETGEFKAAYRIWFTGVSPGNVKEDDLYDGSFEWPISFDDLSFGWLPSQGQTIHVLLDPNDPQSGAHSLQLDYAGNFDPMLPVISQLVLVAPNARYRLNFAARTEGLVSAALPVVVIKNAAGDQNIIAQSLPLSAGTNGWRDLSIDFETTDSTEAVRVSIQRQACSSKPCPIVGRAGFDSFSLNRLDSTAR